MKIHRFAMSAVLCVVGVLVGAGSVPAAPENVIPIGTVQGGVSDAQDGMTHRSPFAPASGNSAGATTVTVQGVVTQKTLARTSTGGSNFGFFLQNTLSTADTDPTTSDGIFVFLGTFTTVLVDPTGTYTPQVGDEIRIRGRVSEFFNLTQLSSQVRLEAVIRTGVDLDEEAPAFETTPPDNFAAANRYWERREGMQAETPSDAIVTGRRDVFPSTADGEMWLIRGDHPLAVRSSAFARRSFRDPHPLDNNPAPLFDDENGYRIVLGSLGLKAAAGNNTVLIAPARTFDTVENALTGRLSRPRGPRALDRFAPHCGRGDAADRAPPRRLRPRRRVPTQLSTATASSTSTSTIASLADCDGRSRAEMTCSSGASAWIRARICCTRSGFSERKLVAFWRPWPRRSSPKLKYEPAFWTTFVSSPTSSTVPSQGIPCP